MTTRKKLQSLVGVSSCILLSTLPAASAVLLFADNFNAPDSGSLDLSDQTGRRSGSNTNIQVRSSMVQHGIVGNQLNFLPAGGNTGRIRFHNDLDNNTSTAETWHDWASGAIGTQILASGGYRLEFDWITGNNTSDTWVSINAGFNGESAGEPGFRVNDTSNDIGLLLRYNGASELFDNGANLGAQGNHTATIGLRHVSVDYLFSSFADGTPVTMIASVDGTQVYNGSPFTWADNGAGHYIELGTLANTRIDNIAITAIPEPSILAVFALGGLGLLFRRRP